MTNQKNIDNIVRLCIFTYEYNMFRLLTLFSLFSLAVSRDLRTAFGKWASDFEIWFESDVHREETFLKWIDNHYFIERVNAENRSYTLGHNRFSGMDRNDFANFLAYSNRVKTQYLRAEPEAKLNDDVAYLPSSVDWVTAGAVTPVKDQGQCGSCWSFSTTGALEGAYFLANGKLKSFSEQQLVDCDTLGNGGRDHGCNGGIMTNAFSWITKNGGLCTEQDYPYVSGTTKKSGTCQTKCANVDGSKVRKIYTVGATEAEFLTALAGRPLSVAIEADTREFQLYSSGIFSAPCGNNLDHGVLAVGYGDGYYKIKNSWSEGWGEKGYMRMVRGSEVEGGECGILKEVSYVEV